MIAALALSLALAAPRTECTAGLINSGTGTVPAFAQVDWESNGCNQQTRPYLEYCSGGLCGFVKKGGWVEAVELNSRAAGPSLSTIQYAEVQVEPDGGGGCIAEEIYPQQGSFHAGCR